MRTSQNKRSEQDTRAARRERLRAWCLLWLAGLACLLLAPKLAAQSKPNTCLDCHAQFDVPLGVNEKEFLSSIHAQKGLGCPSCHGGDSSSQDPTKAMGKAAGFKGHIDRAQVPALCGKCHSDAAYMRGFNPSLRTDQFAQYQTSVHGQRLAKGDTNVAVCIDCHTTHAIRPPNDPASSVYPTNIAQTCSRCHANAEHMKPYKIPTNQFALYNTSVHHDALMVQGDLSAPTCSTCHGSHGAAPPGVASVEHVCSTCHVFQQQLFDTSPHKSVFAAMNLGGCITCHTNHGIQRPSDAMIGTDHGAVCVTCHTEGDAGYQGAAAMHASLVQLSSEIDRSDRLLTSAERAGVEVSDAKLALAEARDSLTKARVTIHSSRPDAVNQDIQAGLKVTQKTYAAGMTALAESRYRRKGLAVSLIAIVFVLIALALFISKLEAKDPGANK